MTDRTTRHRTDWTGTVTTIVAALAFSSVLPLPLWAQDGATSAPAPATSAKDTPAPAYVTDHKDALVLPCTGRFSKEETGIDVVQFNVIVIVRADAVLPFIKELCSQKEHRFRGFFGNEPEQTFMHNQISILESSATAIETDSTKHDLYRYGNGAALELNLICEYVLDRAAYDPIKPQAVKDEMTGDDTNKR